MQRPLQATESHLPNLEGFDGWNNDRILKALLDGQRRALDAVEAAFPEIAQAATKIAERIAKGGKLVYAGAGSSIRVAVQNGSELPGTFGMKEEQLAFLIAGGNRALIETLAEAEDDQASGHTNAQICTRRDALIAIAASGSTPYTMAAAITAKQNGCYVVAVVSNVNSPLGKVADMEIILETGPEVVSGSTRMAAGTAQKAALNLLSTLVHTRLGAVHDGYMVNVVASNAKLKARATTIVSQIAHVPQTQAAAVLASADHQIKPAVLMLHGAKDFAAAQKLLAGSGGNLRLALAKLEIPV